VGDAVLLFEVVTSLPIQAGACLRDAIHTDMMIVELAINQSINLSINLSINQ